MLTTPEQRAEWAKLDKEATPGEWTATRFPTIRTVGIYGPERRSKHPLLADTPLPRDFITQLVPRHAGEDDDFATNAELIAAYRSAVPALCKDVEELEGLVAHFRGQRDHLIAECGRVGVQVNVRIGEPDLTKAYVLENAQVERLTALLREAEQSPYLHDNLRCRIEKGLEGK